MAQGTIKHYDAITREGTLLLDDATEVGIDAGSTERADLRTLRIGQRVKFDLGEEGGRKMARDLSLITFE